MEFALSQAVASGDTFEHRPSERGHCVQDFLAGLTSVISFGHDWAGVRFTRAWLPAVNSLCSGEERATLLRSETQTWNSG